MSKTLWHTISIKVPSEMVELTKTGKVSVKRTLTKLNNVSKSQKMPSIKLIPSNINKPEIVNDGKEWNVEELKTRMKKANELAKKNKGKVLTKNSGSKMKEFKTNLKSFVVDVKKKVEKKKVFEEINKKPLDTRTYSQRKKDEAKRTSELEESELINEFLLNEEAKYNYPRLKNNKDKLDYLKSLFDKYEDLLIRGVRRLNKLEKDDPSLFNTTLFNDDSLNNRNKKRKDDLILKLELELKELKKQYIEEAFHLGSRINPTKLKSANATKIQYDKIRSELEYLTNNNYEELKTVSEMDKGNEKAMKQMKKEDEKNKNKPEIEYKDDIGLITAKKKKMKSPFVSQGKPKEEEPKVEKLLKGGVSNLILHAIILKKPEFQTKEQAYDYSHEHFNEHLKNKKFIRETSTSFRVRVHPKQYFEKTTFVSKKISPDITLVFGKPNEKYRGGAIDQKELKQFVDAGYKSKRDVKNIDGYVLDDELSTRRDKVYVNPNTGKVVHSISGTDNLMDWSNNLLIPLGLHSKTNRYKNAEETQKKANAKYGKQNVSVVSHSQSGNIANTLDKRNLVGDENITLNPAIIGKTNAKVVKSYFDPVSYFTKTKKSDVVLKPTSINPLKEHSSSILEGKGRKNKNVC
jgi:hypothetical protein